MDGEDRVIVSNVLIFRIILQNNVYNKIGMCYYTLVITSHYSELGHSDLILSIRRFNERRNIQ
jgi:hypothetical protein